VPLNSEPGLRIPNMLDEAVAGNFKGLYLQGEDLAQSDPDTQHVVAGLTAMECVVIQDIFLNETAKYAHVFLPGWEEGVFPHQRAMDEGGHAGLEEERRLAYVAITRAKEKLNFSYARSRMIFGKTVYHRRSRFIDEIPEIYVNEHTSSREQIFNAFKPAKGQFGKQTIQTGGLGIGQKAAHTEEKYQAGDIVVHDTFGKGIVLSAKAMGNDMLLEIAFERFGTKKIMANFAKLKRA